MVLELKLDLSEDVAREAQSLGLLDSTSIKRLLLAELKRTRVDQLFAAADLLASQPSKPMSDSELESEIQAARASRRALDANSR